MRRGRIFFYLAFIIILGLVAAVVVWQKYLQPKPITAGEGAVTPPPVVETVDVVVVTQRIPRGNVLDENVVGVIPIQRDLFIQGMFSNVAEVAGRQAKFDLDAGIPLTNGMLVESAEQLSSTGSNAALSIPRGMVAVSVPISRLSSVSYAPQAGDHVNVIVNMLMVDLDTEFQTKLPNNTSAVIAAGPGVLIGTGTGEEVSTQVNAELTKITVQNATGGTASPYGRAELDPVLAQTFYVVPSESQRPRMVSQTLLQDAVVLRMGNFPYGTEAQPVALEPAQDAIPVAEEETPAEGEDVVAGPESPDVVTLIVSPQDAVTLNYLIYGGAQLTMALRATGDDSRVQTEAVTLQFLLDQYNIPVPVKLPYGFEPRIDSIVPPTLKNDVVPTPVP